MIRAFAKAEDMVGHAPQEPEAVTRMDHQEGERQREGTRQALLAGHPEAAPEGQGGVGTDHATERQPGQADPRAQRRGDREGDQEARRHELAHVHHPSDLLRHERLEVAVLVPHAGDMSDRAASVVIGDHAGLEQHPPAVLGQAEIELVVLIARQLLVEQADAVEDPDAEAPEGHGVDPATLAAADAEAGVADTERMRQRHRDGARGRRCVRRACHDHGTDVVGARLLERGYGARNVVGWVHDVGVHADDDVAPRGPDPDVEGSRRDALGVVDEPNHGVALRILRHDRPGPIFAHPVHHQHLEQFVRISGREDRIEASGDIPLLVQAGYDHGNEGGGPGGHRAPPTWLTTARTLPPGVRGISATGSSTTSRSPTRSRRRVITVRPAASVKSGAGTNRTRTRRSVS